MDIIVLEFGFRECKHTAAEQATNAARNGNVALLSRGDAQADLSGDCGSNAFNTPHTGASWSGS